MSKYVSNSEDTRYVIDVGWKGALLDAKQRYETAKPKEKQRWAVVIGVIKQAIERGEPWPGQQ